MTDKLIKYGFFLMIIILLSLLYLSNQKGSLYCEEFCKCKLDYMYEGFIFDFKGCKCLQSKGIDLDLLKNINIDIDYNYD